MSESKTTFSDFVEPDNRGYELLQKFFAWLQAPEGAGLEVQEASPLAHAADRYLRDFVVDILELPPEATDEETVRRYLANWYIVNTLTPTHEEVDLIARAISLLHRFAAIQGAIPSSRADAVVRLLEEPGFFHERLESFWALTPDDVVSWREVCDYRQKNKERERLQ